ncbi:MAG: MIP/aquaporin family protein [Actinomycetes bacterium]
MRDMLHVAQNPLGRRLFAEALGTGLLVAGGVGSGIAAVRLSPGNVGLQLLENMVATGAILWVLITVLMPISGAQLNPIVTAVDGWFGGIARRDVLPYFLAQFAGAFIGVVIANLMFGGAAVSIAQQERSGAGLLLGEVVATFGLLLVIVGLVRSGRVVLIPAAVGCWIVAASWFTSSYSFANPAVVFGRMFSDSFAGIAPSSVPGFVVAECIGGFLAVLTAGVLWPRSGIDPLSAQRDQDDSASGAPYDSGRAPEVHL